MVDFIPWCFVFCQHVQKMVVSLATDKGVWDAVLANEQIQEFRSTLRAADGKHFLSLYGEIISGSFILHTCWSCGWFEVTGLSQFTCYSIWALSTNLWCCGNDSRCKFKKFLVINFKFELHKWTCSFAGAIEHGADLTEHDGNKPLKEEINVFSQFFWNTKTAFSHFIATLQELISGIFDTAEKKVYLSETDDFFERTVRSSMMLSVLVLSLVVFKRSAIHGA